MSESICFQLLADAVVRPADRATESTEVTPSLSGDIELSTRPCASGVTPRSIEACTTRVHGGSTVRAEKHAPPERASAQRCGIRSGVTKRGAMPSRDTRTTGGFANPTTSEFQSPDTASGRAENSAEAATARALEPGAGIEPATT